MARCSGDLLPAGTKLAQSLHEGGNPLAEGVLTPRKPIVGNLLVCCARAASGHAAAPPMSDMNSRRSIIRFTSSALVEVEAVFVAARDNVISPLPVALVEGRRRARRYLPNTTDTLGARKAKVLHQVNQVVAQSKIRRRPVICIELGVSMTAIFAERHPHARRAIEPPGAPARHRAYLIKVRNPFH